MDIYCKHCGNPIDADEFHNGTNSFMEIYRLFNQYGCPIGEQAIDGLAASEMEVEKCQQEPIASTDFLDAVEALQDLMGDDVDGLISSEDDARTLFDV